MSDFFVGVGAAMRWAGYRVGMIALATVSTIGVMVTLVTVAPVLACINYGRLRRGRRPLPATLGTVESANWAFDRLEKPVPWKAIT